MNRIFPFILSLLLLPVFLPGTVFAESPDLSIKASEISFSESPPVSGTDIRIYAAVRNVGDTDMTGYVFFYQGDTPVGASQAVTVPANGLADQFWVDFTVPYGSFNIRAEIRGQDPEDINADNDIAITPLFHPTVDEDRDGVEDAEDNCPETANADQKDTDGDGDGDACDADDDNDGVSDDVEAEEGTDPKSADTDGDGVGDAQDYDPLDADVQTEPQQEDDFTASQETREQTQNDATAEESTQQAQEGAPGEEDEPDLTQDAEEELPQDIAGEEAQAGAAGTERPPVSSAAFTYEREDWKTYSFEALVPETTDVTYSWNFDDGVMSAQRSVTHAFRSPGDYTVTLTLTNTDGTKHTQSEEISISFFHLANPFVKLIIGLLALLFISALIFVLWRGKRKKRVAGEVRKLSVDDLGADVDGEPEKEAEEPENKEGETDAEEKERESEDEGKEEEDEIPEELKIEEAGEEELTEKESKDKEDDLEYIEDDLGEEAKEETAEKSKKESEEGEKRKKAVAAAKVKKGTSQKKGKKKPNKKKKAGKKGKQSKKTSSKKKKSTKKKKASKTKKKKKGKN